MYNRLIHGKNETLRIVSAEVKGSTVELFIEEADGTIRTEVKPNKYWILAPKPYDSEFKRLQGDLHYKYIKLYDDRDKWQEDRRKGRKADIYSIYDEKEAAMVAFGFTYFKGMRVQDVSVLAFDIESQGLEHNSRSKVYIIANTFRSQGKIIRKMFSLDEYESEGDMLDAWCAWVREVNPSIMLGHNCFGYDLPYLQHVAEMNGTELRLGRDGSSICFNNYDSKFRKDGSQSYDYKRCYVYGREIVDSMFLAYKYDVGRKYPSYGLKAIIKYEGLEIENRQFYEAGKISENWGDPEERKKIKAYAEQDGDDALALFDLMIPSFFYWNQSIPKSCQMVNYSATGSQINAFLVRSYLQEFHSIPRASEGSRFEGAISFGVPGIYKNAFKVDVASLYPSIMLQYEVWDKVKDPNGNFFQMVKYFTEERLKNKKLAKETGDRYYKDLEQSQKIGVNSSYGMLGAEGLNFNSPHNAAHVTKLGREILEKSIIWASGKDLEFWLAKSDSTSEDESED